jgi:AraC-like DNA-binding protein
MNALQQQMEGESAYHDSTLTIRKLAEQLTIPEHQLRRLINRHLGYRNFNDYLNRYRIDEAARRLADPVQERLPILTIALEVGYASLTPFNRAFKARHQQTPSEFRRGLAFNSPVDSE